MLPNRLSNFVLIFHLATEKGLLLLGACAVAMLMANSQWSEYYLQIVNMQFISSISFGHFVNDCLMAIFFLLVGLEIKREALEGQLATRSQRILPVVAAIGGVIGPVTIYTLLNWHDANALRGWAVPAATDIAFALGMFALLGRGLPISLRVFLTALAIVDDLIAVIFIAIFYSDSLSPLYLGLAGAVLSALIIACRMKISRMPVYFVLGILLWYCTLKSGVHSTVAGVLLGMCIPLYSKDKHFSPIKYLERILHPIALYFILPIFAFVNSGVSISDFSFATFTNTITLGIILGLFFGKQLGICGSMLLLKKLNLIKSVEFTFKQFYAVSVLCGIGFTMSLFVGALAFDHTQELLDEMKVGVLSASLLSSVIGGIVIRLIKPNRQ
ncbi:MAG: nhaA [Candidatus Midichloriaceae bacterium]|jgi:NhaA family Na+:H+ antiporter|nr:nhaA [Candidatus Midichloriaceae bacterium]